MRYFDTKSTISETLNKMLINNHIDKISVINICTEAGISNRTFYYHFIDKFDLVDYFFNRKMTEALNICGVSDYFADCRNGRMAEMIYKDKDKFQGIELKVMEFWINNPHIYYNLYTSRKQNCFYNTWIDSMTLHFKHYFSIIMLNEYNISIELYKNVEDNTYYMSQLAALIYSFALSKWVELPVISENKREYVGYYIESIDKSCITYIEKFLIHEYNMASESGTEPVK